MDSLLLFLGPWELQRGGLQLSPHWNNTVYVPCNSDDKESACNTGDLGLNPGVRKIPWGREWLPTPVFLPADFHGQRSLADHSPWGRKESHLTEELTLLLHCIYQVRKSCQSVSYWNNDVALKSKRRKTLVLNSGFLLYLSRLTSLCEMS